MSFDVHNIESYLLENINRNRAEELLRDSDIGTFLVRNSSNEGDLALSMKEPSRVGHYQILRRLSNTRCEFTIGNQSFPALPELLTFYKLHYVGEAPLIRPINARDEPTNTPGNEQSDSELQANGSRLARVVISRLPNAYDPTQLHLEKGELIEVLKTNIDGHWEGRRLSTGKVGTFPFNHVKFVDSPN